MKPPAVVTACSTVDCTVVKSLATIRSLAVRMIDGFLGRAWVERSPAVGRSWTADGEIRELAPLEVGGEAGIRR